MSEIAYRPATEDDLPDILFLWRRLQEANARCEPRLIPNAGAARWISQYLREQVRNNSGAVYVACSEQQIIGYIFGQIMRRPTLEAGDCGYVADLCVREDFRRQGVGRRLYERLRAWFISNGVTAIEVQVVRANPASQTFWRKMGFGDFLRTLRKDI